MLYITQKKYSLIGKTYKKYPIIALNVKKKYFFCVFCLLFN
jgi:hypothetical protein